MCGRYSETVSFPKIASRFGLAQSVGELAPRYNIAPGRNAPVIVNEGEQILKEMRWGLDEFMEIYEVSPIVNSPENDSEACVRPL